MPDYLAMVEAETMRPMERAAPGLTLRIVAAARLGMVRLLDNVAVG